MRMRKQLRLCASALALSAGMSVAMTASARGTPSSSAPPPCSTRPGPPSTTPGATTAASSEPLSPPRSTRSVAEPRTTAPVWSHGRGSAFVMAVGAVHRRVRFTRTPAAEPVVPPVAWRVTKEGSKPAWREGAWHGRGITVGSVGRWLSPHCPTRAGPRCIHRQLFAEQALKRGRGVLPNARSAL